MRQSKEYRPALQNTYFSQSYSALNPMVQHSMIAPSMHETVSLNSPQQVNIEAFIAPLLLKSLNFLNENRKQITQDTEKLMEGLISNIAALKNEHSIFLDRMKEAIRKEQ